MIRDDKKEVMINKINESAIHEFNNDIYENVSINQICRSAEISKGIVYHYYKDKDDLYLTSIKKCYDCFVMYYNQNIESIENIHDYIKLRYSFFHQYPEYKKLFFYSLFQYPQHLYSHIEDIKKEYYNFNHKFYEKFLKDMTLRDNVSIDQAMQYIEVMQNTLNNCFKDRNYRDNMDDLIEEHELMVVRWIDFILYGIVKEER